MSSPFGRLIVRSLLRAAQNLDKQLSRGQAVLKLNYEVKPFEKYLRETPLLPGSAVSSPQIASLLRVQFRANKALALGALQKKESDALGLLATMNSRASALSHMVYDPTSTALTNGIQVRVSCSWHNERYQYTISITNEHKNTRQLMRRQWFITNGNGSEKIAKFATRQLFNSHGAGVQENVEGAGVVGHFPVLAPGETYVYTSYALTRGWYHGTMKGRYEMFDLVDRTTFHADIAPFGLVMTARPHSSDVEVSSPPTSAATSPEPAT